MELVRAATLLGYFDVAESVGLDTVPLLRHAGLSRLAIAEPDRMIPARAVIALLEESAARAACPSFALRMAVQRTVADLGLVSLLIAHQPTLREGLSVMQHYRNRINSTLVIQLDERGDTAVLREEWALDPPLPSPQADALALRVLAGIGAWMLGPDWRIEEVRFTHHPAPPPREAEIYRRAFGCPVHFGSDFMGLVLSGAVLDRANPRADPALALQARRMAETMIADTPLSLVQQVEEAVLLQLPEGTVSLAATARALELHPRTLQRRLAAQDRPFEAIVEMLRRRQAARHLANSRLSLTEIAELCGYSSLSAFSRWYRMSHGKAPRQARSAP